jgi:Flp pilus assembly protein TadD
MGSSRVSEAADMLNRFVYLTLPYALAGAVGAAAAADAPAQTGTRVGSEASKLAIMQLHEPTMVERIQALLDENRTDEAVALARDYVDSTERHVAVGEGDRLPERYFALNSLCVALTRQRNFDEAISACDRAIRVVPERWSAINSRGTANFAAGRFAAALSDYRRALAVAPDDAAVRATIEHNIELAEARSKPHD